MIQNQSELAVRGDGLPQVTLSIRKPVVWSFLCEPTLVGRSKNRTLCVYLWACASLCMCAVGAAQGDGSSAALQRCRQLVDMKTRLICYDGISIPGAHTKPDGPAATMLPGFTAPLTEIPGRVEDFASRLATQARVEADFGRPLQRVPLLEISALESGIPGAFEGWRPKTRIRLANGQLWQISDGSEGTYSLRDSKVRIIRGTFGSFFMQIEGIEQAPRVRRIE